MAGFCLSDNNEYCDKDKCDSDCITINDATFGPQNASIIVIEAKGRLGNHLIAFTLVKALAKKLGYMPMVMQNTHDFLAQYFTNISVPILQKSICNWEQITFNRYIDGIDEFIARKDILKGHLLELWPNGYKVKY